MSLKNQLQNLKIHHNSPCYCYRLHILQKKTILEVFKLTWIDLQKLIWMNFKATFLTFVVKMQIFFWILIFSQFWAALVGLQIEYSQLQLRKYITQNWSLSLLISQPLLFNKYFYCKTEIYPPDRLSDNSDAVCFPQKLSYLSVFRNFALKIMFLMHNMHFFFIFLFPNL